MKKIVVWVICAVLLIVSPLAGSSEKEGLLIGLIPERNIFRQYERYLPLARYLSKILNRPVRLTILSKYGDIIDRFSERRLDGAFFGALTGYISIQKLGLRPLVVPVLKDGTYSTPAYIVIRKNMPYKSVDDLRGLIAAFVDKATARGYLFPMSYLRARGIKEPEKFFKEVFFTGSYDAAIYAVADGRADITSVKADVFEKITQKEPILKDELKIIGRSEPIVDTVLCIRKDMEARVAKMLLQTLLQMHENPMGRQALIHMNLKRFIKADMAHFKEVRRLLNTAGTDVRQYNYRIRQR